MLAFSPFLTKWGSLAAIFCNVHFSKTSGLLNLVHQKNVTINWIVSSLHLVGFLKDFPFVEIWATLGGQPRVGREAFPPGASRAGGQHRGEAVSLSCPLFSCLLPSSSLLAPTVVQQQYLPPTLGDHTTGSGRWHNPVFERSAVQWQPGTSATSAAPRLPGFGQWEDKKVKRFSKKERIPHIISLPAMVIFCWVFRRHQYSVVLNILGNTLAAAFPLEAMMSGPDLERPTPGRGNVFSGKRWWWCQSGKIKIYCMTFWCGDTSIPCDHSIWVWCSMFKTVSFQKQPHSLKHVLLEHAECPLSLKTKWSIIAYYSVGVLGGLCKRNTWFFNELFPWY